MLSIVIPVWNLHQVISRLTVDTINSLYNNTLGEWEIIVVTHGGDPLDICLTIPSITMVHYKKRLSIAEAYNSGFSRAKGDLFCCCHNDVIVPFGWNYLMERTAARGDIAFPMIDETKGFCEERGIAKTEPWQTPACLFTLSRVTWDRIGGYDERFADMHGEDIDLFRRAEETGSRLVRCDVTVIHHRGATRSLVKDKGDAALVKAWHRFKTKHGTDGIDVVLPAIAEQPEEVLTL